MGAIFGPLGAKIGIGASLILLLLLSVQTARLSASQHHSKKVETQLVECQANHKQFVADTVAKTAEAQRLDAEHKAQVEAAQEQVRSENDAQIRQRIAAAVAAVRVRNASAQNHSGGSGAKNLPSTGQTAVGFNGTSEIALMDEDDQSICSENTVKAQGWKDWNEAVQSISR